MSGASLTEVLDQVSSESEDESSAMGRSQFVGPIPLPRVETFDVSVLDAMDAPERKCMWFFFFPNFLPFYNFFIFECVLWLHGCYMVVWSLLAKLYLDFAQIKYDLNLASTGRQAIVCTKILAA